MAGDTGRVRTPQSPLASAELSACGRYRYALHRRWADGAELVVVGLNPSTAAASHDDPTTRCCVRMARSHGCGGLWLVNAYAWRSRDPTQLRRVDDPVGPECDTHLERVVAEVSSRGGTILLAWGARVPAGRASRLYDAVVAASADRVPVCLGLTRSGEPRHPLYVAAGTAWTPYVR